MFRHLKISTGLYTLLTIFVIFLATLSIFSITSSKRFNAQIEETMIITQAKDPVQNAVGNLIDAFGLVVVGSFIEQENFEKTGVRQVDKAMLDDIDQMISDANANYKNFSRQPIFSPDQRAQIQRIEKAYNELMNYTLTLRNTLSNPDSAMGNIRETEKHTRQLREGINDKVEEYIVLVNAIAIDRQHEGDRLNTRMLSISIIMLAVSVSLIIMARFWLKKTLFSRLQQTRQTFSLLASGDLSQPIDPGARNEIGEMLAELEKMRASLIGTVSDIRQGVTNIYGSAQEISHSNNELSSRTEQQASALQQTAASMEELKITVRQNADNAHSAKQLVESASSSARKGGDVMVNLDGIMQEITQNSRQIADINGVIDSIANQTNILALNAAVEAARAGEQGRGFAVVAGEVRSLAKRSADAAKEIRQLINVCVSNMNIGSQEVEMAGAAMNEVVKSVTQVTDIMSEITSASDEQSTGINQIAQAVNEMDSVTQQNASMVQQAASVARSVEEYAHNLERAVSQFSLQENAHTHEERDPPYAGHLATVKPAVHKEPAFSKNKAESDWTSF